MATNTPGAKPLTRPLGLVSTLAISIALSGCAGTVQLFSDTQDGSTLNPESVQGDRNKEVKLESFFKLGAQSASSNADLGIKKLRGNYPIKFKENKDKGSEQDCGGYSSFFCRQLAAEKDYATELEARNYLLSGISLSNELCSDWFTRLQVTQTSFRQTSDMVSAMGSLTSAVLGFTRTSSQGMGLTASLFGVGKQSVDSLSANYVIAADLTAVSVAVREYRAKYARDIDQAEGKWNYYTARRVIMAYDNTCSTLSVRQFISARVSGNNQEDVKAVLFDQAIASFSGNTRVYFNKDVTVSQLIDIYAYLFVSEVPKSVHRALEEELKSQNIIGESGNLPFANGKSASDLTNGLYNANLFSAMKERATARIKEIERRLKAEAEEAKEKEIADAKPESEANAATTPDEGISVGAQQAATPKDKNQLKSGTIGSSAKSASSKQVSGTEKSSGLPAATQTDTSRDKDDLAYFRMPTAPDGRPLDLPPKP